MQRCRTKQFHKMQIYFPLKSELLKSLNNNRVQQQLTGKNFSRERTMQSVEGNMMDGFLTCFPQVDKHHSLQDFSINKLNTLSSQAAILKPPVDNRWIIVFQFSRSSIHRLSDHKLFFFPVKFTFRFSPGIDAVRARCCFWFGTLALVTAGVLTSIVFRFKMLGDLLRVYLSRLSSLEEKCDLEIIGLKVKVKSQRKFLSRLEAAASLKARTKMWFKSINEKGITWWIDVITWKA